MNTGIERVGERVRSGATMKDKEGAGYGFWRRTMSVLYDRTGSEGSFVELHRDAVLCASHDTARNAT